MDPCRALAALGGFARWPALTAAGVGRSALLEACRLGLVLRPARGVFCLPGHEGTPSVRAASVRGQISCTDAAVQHGLDVFGEPSTRHVRVARGTRPVRSPRRAVLHRWGVVGAGEVAPFEVTLRDCATCLPLAEAVAVVESALRSGRADLGELVRVSSGWPSAARRVVALLDPGAQSVLESVGRVILVSAGINDLRSQVYIAQVGWVDLLVAGWLVVEWDGFGTHRQAFREDRRRDAELARRGIVVVRFTYQDLLVRRGWVVDVVKDTLQRGHPPFVYHPSPDENDHGLADPR